MSPQAAEDIGAAAATPPNPVDPRSLARGESIQLNEDYYAGIKAKGTYKELQVELGYDSGTRVSSGVRRIDANKVRVMVGDEDFVKQALKFGVKFGDASVSIGNTKELSDGKLHAVDIDIRPPPAGMRTRVHRTGNCRAGHRARATPRRPRRSSTGSTELEAELGPGVGGVLKTPRATGPSANPNGRPSGSRPPVTKTRVAIGRGRQRQGAAPTRS